MVRAVVLIGVSRAGNLETLQAVHDGVRAMEKWAAGQGINRDMIKVITDEKKPVEVSQVKKAVRDLVDLTTVEQLLIYFAGHGVNLSLNEYWLLSGAPEDSNAAVNLAGSVELARFCGIPHVVLISDACRTAADGIQAQAIRGSEIFPNIPDAAAERPVDVFFACALGAPSMELKDPKKAAAGYRAVYTDSLVEALRGMRDVVVRDPDEGTELRLIEVAGDGARRVVRPWPLSFYLRTDVAERLEAASVKPGLSQTPVARINSRGTWLAEVPLPASTPKPVRSAGNQKEMPAGIQADSAFSAEQSAGAPQSLLEVSHSMLRSSLAENRILATDPASAAGGAGAGLQESMVRIFRPFGPAALDITCGFTIRGAALSAASAPGGRASLFSRGHDVVAVDSVTGPAANVLLEFDDGTGMLLPAIPDHVGSVTVEDGDVVNVTYEPARSSPLWEGMRDRMDELRSLRAFLASSARLGVFRLRGADSHTLLERIQAGNRMDPTMAIYAAYAYWDRQESGVLHKMSRRMREGLSLELFDLALLSGELRGRSTAEVPGLFPAVPLLSRGWALIGAHRVRLPPGLAGLQGHRIESLWTLFDPQGVGLIRSAIDNKEIH